MPDNQNNDNNFDDAFRFIIKLGALAHSYGPNAIRLESFLSRVTTSLGYYGVFRSSPTEIYFAISRERDSPQRTHLAIMSGTGLDLARLARVGVLVDKVVAGEITLADAMNRLEEINKAPHPWGRIANAAACVFVGSGFAVLLSGGWWDVFFSALFSLVVYGMVQLSGRFGARADEWLPLSSAFVAGFLAAAMNILLPGVNVVLVTLSAILILIPGFPISVGVIEILSKRVVSGGANLMSGLVYLAKQFAGAWLGVGLVRNFWSIPKTPTLVAVNSQWLWLFMPLLIIGLCVVFQTSLRDFFWAVFGCGIAYGGILLGRTMAGGNLGNLLGTIIAVMYANLWAGKTGRPTSIVLLPAIVLLVSGSIGFRGLAAIASGQTSAGGQQFLQMFIVALTIGVGLLVGNTMVRPELTL